MSDSTAIIWGGIVPFPEPEAFQPLAGLVPAGGASRYEWGLHPPPDMQTGLMTEAPQAILQAFPVATKLMYVIGCRVAERLQGDLV